MGERWNRSQRDVGQGRWNVQEVGREGLADFLVWGDGAGGEAGGDRPREAQGLPHR